jgi:hypothetical protein
MKSFGILLVVIGIIMMVITGFNIITEKKVVDVGPLEINKEVNHPVNWSPIIGGILLIAGIVVYTMDKNRK